MHLALLAAEVGAKQLPVLDNLSINNSNKLHHIHNQHHRNRVYANHRCSEKMTKSIIYQLISD
ncbi:MAG: hypothetical protein GY840_18890 [Pseudoalteromonas sp.]|nr:hypothetical protein [Pseudoalteromonas sp.]